LANLQKADEDVRFISEARDEDEVMEIEISEMHYYYETLSNTPGGCFGK
jgi:hypothetical protein